MPRQNMRISPEEMPAKVGSSLPFREYHKRTRIQTNEILARITYPGHLMKNNKSAVK